MELQYPDGLWPFGKHKYGQYLHILRRTGSSSRPLPWEGITGRVKQESSKLIKLQTSNFKELRLTASRTDVKVADVKAKVGGVEAKVAEMQNKLAGVDTKLDDIKRMLSTLANLERTT